jgi:hypothetical protein
MKRKVSWRRSRPKIGLWSHGEKIQRKEKEIKKGEIERWRRENQKMKKWRKTIRWTREIKICA